MTKIDTPCLNEALWALKHVYINNWSEVFVGLGRHRSMVAPVHQLQAGVQYLRG